MICSLQNLFQKLFSQSIYEVDHNIKPHDFIYKIPYISESFTKKINRIDKDSGFKIKVVIQSGMPLKSLLKEKRKLMSVDVYVAKRGFLVIYQNWSIERNAINVGKSILAHHVVLLTIVLKSTRPAYGVKIIKVL